MGTSEVDGNNVLAALRPVKLRMGNMFDTNEYEKGTGTQASMGGGLKQIDRYSVLVVGCIGCSPEYSRCAIGGRIGIVKLAAQQQHKQSAARSPGQVQGWRNRILRAPIEKKNSGNHLPFPHPHVGVSDG